MGLARVKVPEVCLGPCQIFKMEPFYDNNLCLLAFIKVWASIKEYALYVDRFPNMTNGCMKYLV